MEKSKVIRSILYKFTERFAVKAIGFVIGIVLARLLTPEIAGQVALLEIFVNFTFMVIEDGINNALVQTPNPTERDYSTVFIMTFSLAGAVLVLLELTAPAIAAYYKSPAMVMPLRMYAFALLFGAFNSIQTARMQREMRFREMMFCNLTATVTAGTLGVWLAYRGAGLWALVSYHFAQIVVSCLAAFTVLRWLPRGRFSRESARRLGGYGLRMMSASIVAYTYSSLCPLIIGKRFSTADLGYYERGQKFSGTVSVNLDAAIRSVMFPVLSRSQEDLVQFRAILKRMKIVGSFVIFPVMLGLAAVAEPLIRLLLTEKWVPAVPFLAILSIGEAQMPLTSANLVALKSLGKSQLYVRQEVVRRVLMLAVLIISVMCFDTVVAIAVGWALSEWLDVLVTTLPVKRLLAYGYLEQFKDIWKSALSAAVMAVCVYALGRLELALVPGLVLQVLAGAAVYAGLNLVLKNEALHYVLSLLRRNAPAGEGKGA